MSGTAFLMLDVAIGLVFVYALLSIICSSATEMLNAALRMRAKELEAGLRIMLRDAKGDQLCKKLWEHPLIAAFYPKNYDPNDASNLPAYLPSATFARAIIDIILNDNNPATTEAETKRQAALRMEIQPPPAGQVAVAAGAETTRPTPETLRAEVNQLLSLSHRIQRATFGLPAVATAAAAEPGADAPVQPDIEVLRKGFLALAEQAKGNVDQFRKEVETWYDATMERVSGRFKRFTGQIVFGLGLVIAFALNVDSVELVRHLSTDPASRQKLVELAISQAGQPVPTPKTEADQPTFKEVNEAVQRTVKTIEEFDRQANLARLPVGWTWKSWYEFWGVGSGRRGRFDIGRTVASLLGWLLTAIAISFGAPFWFDLLNKFVSLRSSLKPGNVQSTQTTSTGRNESTPRGEQPDRQI